MPQASAELGTVQEFKVKGLDGKVVTFKAKTIGVLKPKTDKPEEPAPAPEGDDVEQLD